MKKNEVSLCIKVNSRTTKKDGRANGHRQPFGIVDAKGPDATNELIN